jgi:hypothetical protein
MGHSISARTARNLHHLGALFDELLNCLLAPPEVAMRTREIIVIGAVLLLSPALVATIAYHGSNGFGRGGIIADHTTNFRQPVSPVAHPVASPTKSDTSRTPDTEPWGPLRVTDW